MWWSVAIERVEGKWLYPEHCEEWCHRLEFEERTATVSARYHLKSITAQAYVAYCLWKNDRRYLEIEYMSYKSDTSEYLLRKLKRYIEELPELFDGLIPCTKAETILHYMKDGHEFLCMPSGILQAMRGRHPHILMCDDILRDPEKKLDITQLVKIEKIFMEQAEQMPTEQLHVVGTPQDRDDLFAKLSRADDYDVRYYPATNVKYKGTKHEVLWHNNPKFDAEGLERQRKKIGDKAFNKEFLCKPVRGEEGFLKEEQIDAITWKHLKNHDLKDIVLRDFSYAGYDIGKKCHPSHIAVFGVDRKNRMVQVLSKWMDGWDYTDQLEYCRQITEMLKIDRMNYDDTRAELEGFKEQGELVDGMFGVVFGAKNKFKMAVELDRMVTQGRIILLNDPRQKRQLMNVDNDLKAVQTAEGHGDCFFSICLAVVAFLESQGELIWTP